MGFGGLGAQGFRFRVCGEHPLKLQDIYVMWQSFIGFLSLEAHPTQSPNLGKTLSHAKITVGT